MFLQHKPMRLMEDLSGLVALQHRRMDDTHAGIPAQGLDFVKHSSAPPLSSKRGIYHK